MSERIINTNYGKITGVQMDGYHLYKGIPYAKPPVGERRWKAPEPVEPWDGIYEAVKWGDMGMQDLPEDQYPMAKYMRREFYSNPEFVQNMSEDTLYLNVWTPDSIPEGEKLPVAFWIHGGGFGSGSSSEVEFDGEAYCKRGVILVTITYRINIYGFLAHPWLDAENERGISGNYGILDQIAALRWVYENIEAFGGDPSNITIFGQSAGSMSTQVLISSPLTENIPAKAILQSGVSCVEDFLYTPTLEEEEEWGKLYVELTGAKDLAELRSMTTEQLEEARGKFGFEAFKRGNGISMVPNKDGYLLPLTVKEAWKSGEIKKIPYMVGCVIDDLGTNDDDRKAGIPGMIHEEDQRFAEKCQELGLPSYVYIFSNKLPGDQIPAFHSAEIWYTMGTLKRSWRPVDQAEEAFMNDVVDYWTNFMKYGDPKGTDKSDWQIWTKENPYTKEFK